MHSLVRTYLLGFLYTEQLLHQAPSPGLFHIHLLLCWNLSVAGRIDLVECSWTKFLILMSEGSLVLLWVCLLVDWWIGFIFFHVPQPHSYQLLHAFRIMVILRSLYFLYVILSLVEARNVTLVSDTPSRAIK